MIFSPDQPRTEHERRGALPCWCPDCQRRDREMLECLAAPRTVPPQPTTGAPPA